ncbi:MAG TPA: hypothetical protein VLR26_12205 [Frankiaceae bacterium]|nr:hypothetical protein [Frankiaceae bacterium]
MNARQQLGAGLLAATVAALPVVFFLTVVRSLVLACAAVIVEVGLFTASRIALKRPAKPVGAARFTPPSG